MPQAGSRPAALRWVAPALLLGIVVGLGPLWWDATVPPRIETVRPWRDPSGALMVPATAVRPLGGAVLAEGGDAVVFVIEDGVPRAVRVALGVVGPDSVVVATGLAERALVAVNPPRGIEDRRRVADVR